jgi:hypothetical protein
MELKKMKMKEIKAILSELRDEYELRTALFAEEVKRREALRPKKLDTSEWFEAGRSRDRFTY